MRLQNKNQLHKGGEYDSKKQAPWRKPKVKKDVFFNSLKTIMLKH